MSVSSASFAAPLAAPRSASRLPLLATALGCAGILALGWFLGAAPALDAAALSGESRATADAQNVGLKAELVALAEQHSRIDAIRADVASLRREVPAGLRLPDLVDQISAVAAAHGVALSQFSAEEPISPLTLSAVAQPAAAVEGAASADSTTPSSGTTSTTAGATSTTGASRIGDAEADESPVADPEAADSTTPSSLLSTTNLFAVPIALTIKGMPADARAALGELQHGERLFLVTSTKFSTADDPEDSSAEVRGYAYVLLGAAG